MTNAPWLGKKFSAEHKKAISEGLTNFNRKKRRRVRRRIVLPITCPATRLEKIDKAIAQVIGAAMLLHNAKEALKNVTSRF